MFDTIAGLPVHPLVVHAVVVLLPLASVVTAAVAVRPAWRRFAPAVVALNAVVLVAAFAARQSGEILERRIRQFSTPPELANHTEWGSRLVLLALALFLGAIVVWVLHTRGGMGAVGTAVGVLAVVGAVGTIGLTVYVGHTGASAVWKQIIENTSAP